LLTDPLNTNTTTLLTKRDDTAFEMVFKTYFKRLHSYAFTILKNNTEAEDIVQKVFVKLWEKDEDPYSLPGSLNAYLYRAVHNESLNYLKHQRVKASHQLHVAYSMKNATEQPARKIFTSELEQKIQAALNQLPEQCRTIFQMSRFDELKYREIADMLDISVKTVENQMGKALKLLRIRLAEFLIFLLLFFTF
jgi:RNA polymerase sigma-70 factor, ECF subfamily